MTSERIFSIEKEEKDKRLTANKVAYVDVCIEAIFSHQNCCFILKGHKTSR